MPSRTLGALLVTLHSKCPDTPIRKGETEAFRGHPACPGPRSQEEPTPAFELEAAGP